MRLLWLKQLEQLESDGGLSFNTLGFTWTYVKIIEIIVYTATIIAIFFRI